MNQAATAERSTDDPPRPASGISLRVVANSVRRHPIVFTGVILLALAVGLGIWFFLPLPKKTAAAVFHVSSQPQTLLASGPINAADFAAYKNSQMALIKSRRTFNSVLNEPEVKVLEIIRTADPDEFTWLDKHVVVDSKTGSEFIRVTIEGDNGVELHTFLAALVKAFMKATAERDNGARNLRLTDLKEKNREIKAELQKSDKTKNEYRRLLGGIDGAYHFWNEQFRQTKYMKELADFDLLKSEYEAIVSDLAAAKSNLEAVRTSPFRTAVMSVTGSLWAVTLPQGGVSPPIRISAGAIEEVMRRDSRLQSYEGAVEEAAKILDSTKQAFQPGANSPALVKTRDDLKAAEDLRDKYRRELRERIEVQLKELAALDAEGHFGKVQAEHDRINVRMERGLARIEQFKKDFDRITETKIDLDKLLASISQKEKLSASMTEEIDRMTLELNLPARVTVAEDAYIINGIEGNRRLKYTLMAGLGSFVLGFSGLVMWEHRCRRVTRTEEVTSELGARLIGTIPPLVPTNGVAASDEVNTPLVEAIDTTRIMLTHANADGSKLRVLMVTSAVSGEGKTTLSGNLAISLTRAGFRTLLIDGDMQAPSAHLLFDLPDAPGLSELLRGETGLAQAVRSTPIPGLSVLPAGRWNMSTRQSLVGDRWRILKQQLESEFDFVVIDTSPLLMVSDAMLLAREADGVVLSVLLGVSQIARVAETVNRLHDIGAELAGVVVNNVQSDVYRRYMSRAKYAVPPPVAPDQDETAFAMEDEAPAREVMAEEIGVETAANTKEGS